MQNAYMIFAVLLTLIALAIGQSLIPQITTQATYGRYVRMGQMILKVVGGSVLLSIPASVALFLLGKHAIHILFEHGAFTRHSSNLTNMVLLGYAIGLPGLTAGALLVLSFYALKDAQTPLLTNIVALAARISLIVLLLKLLAGTYTILAIPLAMGIAGTVEAVLLCLILLIRLRAKVKADKGMQRLHQRRLHARNQIRQTKPLVSLIEEPREEESEGVAT